MEKKVALLTGGSRGIGAAIKQELTAKNIEVYSPSRAELDLANNDSINAFIQRNRNTHFSILINNAGINPTGTVENFSDLDMENILQVNYQSALKLIRAFIPKMIENNYGRIVNIASLWSVAAKAGRINYSASKAALVAASKCIAVEVAKHNILVNCVSPGYTLTELTKVNNSEADLEKIKNFIPIGRLAVPTEIAKIVNFLCSEENSYLLGQNIVVDGGYSIL